MPLEEHLLRSASGEYVRTAWLLRPEEDQLKRLCVFLDAEFYLNRMEAVQTIEGLGFKGTTCLFISHLNAEARHHDYTCNPRYAEFIANDVFSWAKERFPSLESSGHLLVGLSLSGLQSAYTVLNHPQRFSGAVCQSGSLWWNGEWLTGQAQDSAKGRFWISVGDQEVESGIEHPPTGLRQDVSQLESVERFAQKLRDTQATVHYRVFAGGHETAPWAAELRDALTFARM